MAQKVKETGKEEILDVMNPYERRIVHIAVNQISGLTTESLGDGFLKKIRIFKVEDSGQKGGPYRINRAGNWLFTISLPADRIKT